LVGGFGPDEGFGMTVVVFEVVADGVFQFAGAAMDAAAQLFFGEACEPALDQVEPGGAGRRRISSLRSKTQIFLILRSERAANVLDKLTDTHQIDGLILMGPHEDTHFFAQYLPRRLRHLLYGHIPSPPKPGASAGEVLKRVAPAIENSRQAQELALLQEVRELRQVDHVSNHVNLPP
jgi:hypothetical protein